MWNFKEPLSRKSCSCTSSSNISRSRIPPPARSPFGINRPSPSPGSQNNQNALASKLKKDKEKKPIMPFHQRPIPAKFRQLGPASKGLATCNVATHVADQNRQPNSKHQNETSKKATTTVKSLDIIDDKPRQEAKPKMGTSVPFTNNNTIVNNNNNNDEACVKRLPSILTKPSKAVSSPDNREKSTSEEDIYHGYTQSCKSTPDVWKCYDIFTGDPKLKPRLPGDVLDQQDRSRLPLTTESVASLPEDTGEVFTIETIENEK